MSKGPLFLFALLLLVATGILLLRSCQDAPSGTDVAPSSQAASSDADPASAAATDAAMRARAISGQRDEASRDAASTLHRYLAALGSGERDKADAFWVGKQPPATSGEADLRSLEKLQSLRTQNSTPVPLDSSAVPNALEIPVELRVNLQGQPLRHYRGWYRMRRAVADGSWEITSASIEPVTR